MKQIAILLGGRSAEHEVSLMSGGEVFKHIDRSKFNPHKFLINKDGSFSFGVDDLKKMDAVFIALHGQYGEDGCIQGFLETLGLKYTGPKVYSSALGMDKYLSKEIWKNNELPIIPHKLVQSPQECLNNIYPFVLKPRNSGSSVGVSIVKNETEVEPAFLSASKEGAVILEDYIKGKELTVGVLANSRHKLEALPIIEIIPALEFYNYEAKYFRDDTGYKVPADLENDLEEKIKEIAVRAAGLLFIDTYSRVDIMLSESGPYLMEINTLPGMTSHSLLPKAAKVAGISYTDLISQMIELSL